MQQHRTAPSGAVRAGACASALTQRNAMAATGQVTATTTTSGTYTAVACGFLNTNLQPYDGAASVTTLDKVTAPPPH